MGRTAGPTTSLRGHSRRTRANRKTNSTRATKTSRLLRLKGKRRQMISLKASCKHSTLRALEVIIQKSNRSMKGISSTQNEEPMKANISTTRSTKKITLNKNSLKTGPWTHGKSTGPIHAEGTVRKCITEQILALLPTCKDTRLDNTNTITKTKEAKGEVRKCIHLSITRTTQITNLRKVENTRITKTTIRVDFCKTGPMDKNPVGFTSTRGTNATIGNTNNVTAPTTEATTNTSSITKTTRARDTGTISVVLRKTTGKTTGKETQINTTTQISSIHTSRRKKSSMATRSNSLCTRCRKTRGRMLPTLSSNTTRRGRLKTTISRACPRPTPTCRTWYTRP